MRTRFAFIPLLLAATPAFATSSIHCRTAGGPDIWLTVPNDRGAGISDVRIVNGREEIATSGARGSPHVTASVVNPRRLSFSLAPGGARGTFVSLAATRRGVPYVGTITLRGRSWPVRCFWDEDDEE